MDYSRFITRTSVALVILFVAGLAGWYFFLRGEENALESLAVGRGFSGKIPSFTGIGGSTLENIIEGLGFQGAAISEGSVPPRLWKVNATPTAGFGFVANASSTELFFMERSTGYVFRARPESGNITRLTNTLIPKVYEAAFSKNGSVVGSILSEERTKIAFSAALKKASTTEEFGTLLETSLGEGTIQTIPSPNVDQLLSLVTDGIGSALIRSNWDGSKPERIFASSLRDWRVHAPKNGSIVLAQKPASGIAGNAYRLATDGSLSPLVQERPGLTVLPHPTTAAFIYGEDSGELSLFLRTGATSSPVTLSIRTVADKCVWASDTELVAYCAVPTNPSSSQFLNDWYRGLAHTSDAWWRIDARTGEVDLLFNAASGGNTLDVESPAVDDTGEYIAFMNARDKSLWMLRIEE